MEETLKFRIESLFTEDENDEVIGPMSPVLFAKEMAKLMGIKFNRLARVHFDQADILQRREDGGLTGYDHLILGVEYKNNLWLLFWVDMGFQGLFVANSFKSNKEIDIQPIYGETEFAVKLTEAQIRQVFEFIFENPEVIAIKKG